MQSAVALLALALLAALLGSAWRRRSELGFNGEAVSMLLGLILCFGSVVLILLAAS